MGQISELESDHTVAGHVTDDERDRLRYLIRSIVLVTIGVTFLSTVTSSMATNDFNQFAEPFRRAVLRDGVPTWREMCTQIQELVDVRGF